MSCYHPKKGFIIGKTRARKNKLKFVPYEVRYISENVKNRTRILNTSDDKLDIKRDFQFHYDSFCANSLNCGEKLCTYKCDRFSPRFHDSDDVKYFYEFFTIPCGQCLGCRLDYSKEWACRMMLELPYSSSSCFITLTYDDDSKTKVKREFPYPSCKKGYIEQYPNVVDSCVDFETGECREVMTLNTKDFELFMKRLRREFGAGIRYYMCGEYGDRGNRPHYHAVIFNFNFPDREFFKRSPDGKFNYYVSDTLKRLWPFGYHLITDVTFETCAYVARYVTKKAKGFLKEDYLKRNLLPEFSHMSRRPGIGRQWFDEHGKDAYNTYIINVSTLRGGLRLKPPRYYDNLYDVLDEPSEAYKHDSCKNNLKRIKENKRFKAECINRLKLDNTDLGYLDMLKVEEYNFKHNPKNKFGLLRERNLDV